MNLLRKNKKQFFGLLRRNIHSSRSLGNVHYDWYFRQLEKDEKEKEFKIWLAGQPLLPPVRKEGHIRKKCFFDYATIVSQGEFSEPIVTPIGKVVFELVDDYLPDTCQNFIELCEGKRRGYDPENPSSYKHSKVDQVLRHKFICGGQLETPVYPFADEGFIIRQREGILGMNQGGSHQNTSHYYINLQDSFHLQGINVAFGAVVEGLDIVRTIGNGLARRGKLISTVEVVNCGVIN